MKTTRLFSFALAAASAKGLRGTALFAALAAAGLAHAQTISSLPASLAVYSNQTVTTVFALTGWGGSNVAVTVEGPATTLLSTCTVNPASGTDTSRSLVTKGDAIGGPSALRVIAAETPTAVNTVTGTVNVTVRAQPTVAYSSTNGFHNGHIDQDSSSATLTVTHNAAATVLWGKHSNTALFPSSAITPSGNTFSLVPLAGKYGSDTFTIYATDAAGGWTNSVAVALTVEPVPVVKSLQTSVVFNEDTAGTNTFSIAYGGNTNLLMCTVTFSPGSLIETHTFLTVGGISTNLALVMYPYANANGSNTATLVVSDGSHVRTNLFTVTVTPVPDPPSITGLPAEITIANTDPWTNAFTSVTFADPDDDRPSQEKLDVTVSDAQLQLVFDGSAASTVTNMNAKLSEQNTWIRSVDLKAMDDLFGVVGTTNDVVVKVIASGRNDALTITNTMLVHVHFKNTPPEFVVRVNPGQEQMDELETHTPFLLESITDPDDTQTSFTLSLFLAPGYEAYGTLSKSIGAVLPPAGGVIGTGNRADLDYLLRNTQFNASEGVLTNSQGLVYFIFQLSDGFDTTVKTNAITLNQLKRPPAIYLGNEAPKDIYVTSAAPMAIPYSKVFVTDPDEAGNQPVKALIGVSPNIGSIDMTTRGGMDDLQNPATLTDLLRAATFSPYGEALAGIAVGQSISARLTLTVVDETGLSAANSDVVVHIERVNGAPDLRVPEEQPVLFSPGVVIRPFADVQLSSDDTNAVTFAFSIDDPAKGAFGNVDVSASGFTTQGEGRYTITTADIGHILNLVTNITFTPSVSYPFPPDDPSGTVFTLSAKDYQLYTTTRTLAIQVQDPPRNWLVTKMVNDGAPGTFQHALAHAANNDVITFALPSYPATIRMSATNAVIETGRALTIKGPGADLLTVSGDTDGNGTPDRQILVVGSPVTIEGVTFAQGRATDGGAIAVTATGRLVLRNVVIRDSVASQYGGAIDVYGGWLSVEGCAFLRNTVTEEYGAGGGAVSLYTDHDVGITNTLFDSNAQLSLDAAAGGAIYAELIEGSLDDYAAVEIVHCTFSDNADASLDYTASSVYAGSGTHVKFFNTIFADDPAIRTLNRDSGATVESLGGNICDDSTYVPLQPNYLLGASSGDLTVRDARLSPLNTTASVIPCRTPLADSPALGFSRASAATVLDQRGLLRVPGAYGIGTAGAIDPAAVTRTAITEIQLSDEGGDTDQFIELYAPRDGQDIDLSGFTLFVNGVAVHRFGQGVLALTNSVYTTLAPAAGIPASYHLTPGRGVVIAFPAGEVADVGDFSPLNPTPVVRASIVTNAAEFARLLSAQGRGSVAVASSETAAPIVRQTYLTVFNDPDSAAGTSRLDTAHNSIASAPQGRGFAFLPHSSVSIELFGGWRGRPSVTPSGVLLQSPGATVDGTPFGQDNAAPLALPDFFTLTEDDVGLFDPLANDFDPDGNDRIVIVDVSTASEPGTNDAASALSELGALVTVTPSATPLRGAGFSYDPRAAAALQRLPVGVEILDTFYYEIIDIGAAATDAIEGGDSTNTWVTVRHHRLHTGDSVVLSGASVASYNGEFEIVVIDEHTFAIPVPFETVAAEPGVWAAVDPRTPSARSEVSVTVKVTGLNDAPVVAGDVVTNVTEVSTVRIMVRPEKAGTALSLSSDPLPPPVPNPAHLLDNDTDIDTDETWQTLRLVGVMGQVRVIEDYTGTAGSAPVTVRASAHGLTTGAEVLIANYGGYATYNGYHVITVIDPDTFTIPVYFVDNHEAKGVWVVLNEGNRYHAVTDVGATVDLTLRADPREDCLIYNAAASAFLKGVAEGEKYTNRFYQAVQDSHGAIGIGTVDVIVDGVNDTPTAPPDPEGLGVLTPLVTTSNTLEEVLAGGLELLYTLPPVSGTAGRTDLQVLDRSGTLPGTIVMRDLWFTDEDTAITIETADLLVNDADIDRTDVLYVAAVDALSRQGAALSLAGGQIVYDPAAAGQLQALAREEMVADSFFVAVSDGKTGGTVTSLVAVVVSGRNDTPVARPDAIELSEDDVFTFNPILYPADNPAMHDVDLDIDGQWPDDVMTVIAVSNLLTTGQSRVDLEPLLARYDATVSERMNQLADWQDDTDSFEYTITDNSFLFAVADEFYVPADTVDRVLDVLANDRDFTVRASTLTIVEAGPTLNGGTVAIAPDGAHLVYSSAPGQAGDDYFRYVVQNAAGDRHSARVLVRSVIPPLNGVLSAADDHYAVAYGETAVLDVLANDNMLPAGGTGLTLTTNIVATSVPGQPVLSGNAFVYTATNGLSPLLFTYEVSAGGTSVAQADVTVAVIDRRGTLKVRDDAYSVEAGSSDNTLEVLANDALLTGDTASLRIAALLTPAALGTAVISPDATALVYTPNAGVLGVDEVLYLATDGVGGTGTGRVAIAVGTVETTIDFYTVAASTSTVSVALNVLANDGIQPFPAGALTLVAVSPAETAIGSMQVSGDGARLEFVASNVTGQVDFDYVVEDSSARASTGRVVVATVAAGLYANADRFLVRGNGSGYELDVLANDRSYPDIDKTYTLLSIGTGADAPSAGGSVGIVSNRLVYTPAAGFFGQESFTYVMSDSESTDTALVTVTVSRGDLIANADHYAVFYELADGGPNAKSFTLPVTLNDRIQPPLGQAVQITGLGVGANAPDHLGVVTVGADGLSLVYRPVEVPSGAYVERFTYEISDGAERRVSATVEVQVLNRASELSAVTQDDAFTVARNSAGNVLPLLANDFVRPGAAAGWTITGVSSTACGGTVSNGVTCVVYEPPADFVGVDTFTYSVNDGLGGTGGATVRVRVGERPTLPDLFVALSGTVSNTFDVVANDVLDSAYADEYVLAEVFGATHGGSVAVSPDNTVLYAPDASYAGPYPYVESFLYTASDDAAGLVTGSVQVVVHETGSDRSATTVSVHVLGRNDAPVILNEPPNVPITDKQTATPFTGVTFIEVDEQTHEVVDVEVSLDSAAKGVLTNLGAFVSLGEGRYAISNVTAAFATAQVGALVFVPAENRITVPTWEDTRFTLAITDNKSPVVTDTQTVIRVTAVNDAPVVSGARSNQTVYAATALRLFSSVLIQEVDDLTLQPLDVTVQLSDPTHGTLQRLGSFAALGGGVYRAEGLTAAAATLQLRAMEFLVGTNKVVYGAPQLTTFLLTVSDRFAPPVQDNQTSVRAYNASEGMIQPTNTVLQTSFGHAVDALGEYAAVGAPEASVNGNGSGVALIYRLQPGTTNTWTAWRQLLPAGVGAGDGFGCAVSMNGDLLAVGAREDASSAGSVYLFQRDLGGTGNWGLLRHLAPTNLPANSRFGFSVHLDGDVLAVGAPQATLSNVNPPEGAVLLYARNQGGGDAWGEIRRWEPAGQTSLSFGWSVALSGDRLVVGAPGDKTGLPAATPKGAVYYLSRHAGGTNMWGLAQKLVVSNFTSDVDFGNCVSVDGDLLAVGAPRATVGGREEAGQVFVYGLATTSNAWQALTRLDRRNETDGLFGYTLSVNKDFIFIGAPDYVGPYSALPFTGCAYLFRRSADNPAVWNQVEKLRVPTADSPDWRQYGVAVSFQQDVAIVGVVKNETLIGNSVGAAYLYRFKFNNAPVVAAAVPDRYAEWGEPFAYTIPGGIFADPDVGDVLTLLPSLPTAGTGFGLDNLTVTGTPTVIGPVQVQVMATDQSDASATHIFRIVVLVDGKPLDFTMRNMWNLFYFGKDVVNPALESSVWGGTANGDGDPLDNDHEYAFGGDPTIGAADMGNIGLAAVSGGNLLITYVRRSNDSALFYTLQGSASLSPIVWENVDELVTGEFALPIDESLERVTLTVGLPETQPVMFFRIIVSQ